MAITGSITDLCNLKFFTDAGTEVHTQQQYTITWKLDSGHPRLNTIPQGFILGDIEKVNHIARTADGSDFDYYRLKPDSLIIGFTTHPEVILSAKEYKNMDSLAIQAAVHKILCTDKKGNASITTITINTGESSYSVDIQTNQFFEQFSYVYKVKVIYTGDNDDIEINECKYVISVTGAELTICDDRNLPANKKYCLWEELDPATNYTTILKIRDDSMYPMGFHQYLYYLLEPNERAVFRTDPKTVLSRDKHYAQIDPYDAMEPARVKGLANLFPFIKYTGSLVQETISARFTAANTIVILEEAIYPDPDDPTNSIIKYERPAYKEGDKWELAFECPEYGELKVIETNTEYEITQKTGCSFLLGEGTTIYENSEYIRPFTFTIGVIAPDEGCYQNYLGMYMRLAPEPDIAFFMGMLVIKTEVVQEDTRYRTLLENFGIPDPKNYHTLFAEANYEESLPDYELINRKSKELMLTYDQIFPYAGTYKALINALKFLGYEDILIKEWYKIFDNNGQERDVALDSIDILNNKLGDMLDKYQTSPTRKYTKLDYLSIVYHLNQIIEQEHPTQEDVWSYTPGSDNTCDRNNPLVAYFDVPTTEPIYAYRTDEITAKLYALKRWLETYITGVSCRIVSITGEGVYFAPMKSQIYPTHGLCQDFISDAHLTPAVVSHTSFLDSKSDITCTLREFENLKFQDLNDHTFGVYIQENLTPLQNIRYDLKGKLNYISSESKEFIHNINFNILMSNPVSAPVIGDDYRFELQISPESMSLYPWISNRSSMIRIENDVISLSGSKDTIEFDSVNLPTFIIETGNLRIPKGTWERNTEWMIQERIDNDTMESVYKLQNIGSFAYAAPIVNSISHICLKPSGDDAVCLYSSDNKWGVPCFMIQGYQFDLSEYSDADGLMSDAEIAKWFHIPEDQMYILEIVDGRMLQDKTFDDAEDMSYELKFHTMYDAMQQNFRHEIKPTVTYSGERVPVKIFDQDTYTSTYDFIKQVFIPDDIDANYTISSYDVINFIISNVRFAGMDKYYLDFVNKDKQNFDALTEKGEWLIHRELLKQEARIVTETLNALYENISTNTSANITVHHLGTYSATAKMYDRYNNIYVNNASKTHTINALPYGINIIMNQANSSNGPEFYSENINGTEIQRTTQECKMIDGHKIITKATAHKSINNLLPKSIYQIKYPKYYDLYDIQNNDVDHNNLYFWNYSYANIVPVAGDQILLSNRATKVYLHELPLGPEAEDLHLMGIIDYSAQQQVQFKPGDDVLIYKYSNPFADKAPELDEDEIPRVIQITGTIYDIVPDDSNEFSEYTGDWKYIEKKMRIVSKDLPNFISKDDKAHGISYYMINISRYPISLDDISTTNEYMDSFTIQGYPGIQHFREGNVITINYNVNEHPYDDYTISYNGTQYLQNALYDAGYPSLIIYYDNDIEPQEHQYNRMKLEHSKNVDVKLNYMLSYMKHAFLVCYQYDPEMWYTYDVTEYIKQTSTSEFTGLRWEAARDLIFQTGRILENEPTIKRTAHVVFDRYDNEVTFRFQSEKTTSVLYNSVSYRIKEITETKKMVRNKGMMPIYTYTVDGSLDTTLMSYYASTGVYDVDVTVSYPYQEFVQYTANVTETGVESVQNFGTHDYSMMRTDFLYDADSMMLDSYLDQQFIGRVYEFDPSYLKRIWITKQTSLTSLDEVKVIPLYRYCNHPVTIKAGSEMILTPQYPEKDNNPFKHVSEHIWSWEANIYDDSDYQEHIQEHRFRHHCVFKCLNHIIAIKPDTYGVNDVILTAYDDYGNKLENRSEALVYIK